MSDEDRLDQLAAEYVLGTLRGASCARFEERMRSEPALAARVRSWELRMAPLTERFEPTDVPDRAWAGIEARLFPTDPATTLAGGGRSPAFWQRLAVTFASLAVVCLASVVYVLAGVEKPQCYAVLSNERSIPMAVVFDRRSMQELVVVPVGSQLAGDSGTAQLWIVAGNTTIPVGLLSPDRETRLSLDKPMLTAVMAANARLLVTREPGGGSTKGAPVGDRIAEGVVALLGPSSWLDLPLWRT